MSDISRIFDTLDEWRHLPDYQLERRADIFFAAYLPAFLSARLKLDIRPSLVPEFPVHIGTIYPHIPINRSFKIDYLALDASGSHAVFVELKTDSSSRREKQDKYLLKAKAIGLSALLEGLLKIVWASESKHKYCCLLRLLEKHGLLMLPSNLDAALSSKQFLSAVNVCLPDVRIVASNPAIQVLYLQPIASLPDEIGFAEFAEWLETRGEALAMRFAQSLRKWATIRPGWVATQCTEVDETL